MVLATEKFGALQKSSANRLSNNNSLNRLIENWTICGAEEKKTQLLVDASGKALQENTSRLVGETWINQNTVKNVWSGVTGEIANQRVRLFNGGSFSDIEHCALVDARGNVTAVLQRNADSNIWTIATRLYYNANGAVDYSLVGNTDDLLAWGYVSEFRYSPSMKFDSHLNWTGRAFYDAANAVTLTGFLGIAINTSRQDAQIAAFNAEAARYNGVAAVLGSTMIGSLYSENGSFSEIGHSALDAIGFIPVFGEIADGVNALWYAAEGDYTMAGLSAGAMIPIVGDLAFKGGKYALKAYKVYKAAKIAEATISASHNATHVAENAAALGAMAKTFRNADPHDVAKALESMAPMSAGAAGGLGRAAAESIEANVASVLRQLRNAGTTEASAVASMIKRGKIDVSFLAKDPTKMGAMGQMLFGTKKVEIYLENIKSVRDAAGIVAHEAKHVLQQLTEKIYTRQHEIAAYQFQRAAFRLNLTDKQIVDFVNSSPLYRHVPTGL